MLYLIPFYRFIIFLNIFSIIFGYSYTDLYIELIPETTRFNYSSSYCFKLKYPETDYNLDIDFLTIKIENRKENYFGHLSFISTKEGECKEDRKQMAINAEGDSIFILKKSDINNTDLYLCVNCLNNSLCYYGIKFDQNYIQRMPTTDISYTYYASQNYSEMDFGIRTEDKLMDKKNKTKSYEIYWIKRLNNFKFIHYNYTNAPNDTKKEVPDDYNIIYMYNTTKENRFVDFNVSSNKNDQIIVGSSLIINDVQYKPLNVNDIESFGNLQRGINDKICYNLSIHDYYKNIANNNDHFYIKGFIEQKIAKTYFKYSNINYKFDEKEITDGNIFEVIYKNETRQFCITFSDSNKYKLLNSITFSIQLISNKKILPNYYFNFPQISDLVIPHILKKGDYIALTLFKFIGISDMMSLTVCPIYGHSKLYLNKTDNFPFDDINNMVSNKNNLKEISINKMQKYNKIENDDFNSFYYKQNLFIIECPDNFCIFNTLSFSSNDSIILSEDILFSQYLFGVYNENKFVIDFENYLNATNIIVELFSYNSEINLNIANKKSINLVNYFLFNKEKYIIDTKELRENKLWFSISSNNKAYYSIKYNLITNGEDLNKINLLSIIGINYIDYIFPEYNYTIFEIQSCKYNQSFPTIFNIFSPNCKIRVEKDNIQSNTSLLQKFYQDYLDNDKDKHIYNISIINSEPLNYKENKCLLFTNNLYISENSIGTLIMNEDIPHIFKFEKESPIKTVRYIYPKINTNRETFINLQVINKAKYFIKLIQYNNKTLTNINEGETFYKSKIISLKEDTLECNDEECKFIIEISLNGTITNENPMLETTLTQNKYKYMQKETLKDEFVKNDGYVYLYTDINKETEGYILYYFLKENDEITAKIVEQNQINIKEDNWDDVKNYKLISNYDFVTQKLTFNKKDTSNCQEGCYLLIKITSPKTNLSSEEVDYFPFKIMVSLTNQTSEIPIIGINDDEYVISSLLHEDKNNDMMYELFNFIIPYDCDGINIECISDSASLKIIIENKKIKDINPGKIFTLSKKEINQFIKKQEDNSIEYINIQISPYIEKTDIIEIIYSFKVHINKKNDILQIYKINSNQKTLCVPTLISNSNYRCLFMIEPSYFFENLILYSKSYSKYGSIQMYGKYLENNDIYDRYDKYDMYDIDDKTLENSIPDENNHYDEDNSNKNNLIIITSLKKNNYFFVSVTSNSSDSIEFFANFYNYDDDFILTPNLMQIFVLKNNFKNEIKLNVLSENSIMINIESINGNGELNYNHKVYNLKEKDKILFAFNSTSTNDKLYFKNKNESEEYIFSIEYYLRSSVINYDKMDFGKNSVINFNKMVYPLFLYSKIENNFEYDINIFFNFYNLNLSDNSTRIITNKELNIISLFSNKSNEYKLGDELNNKNIPKIKGIYEPSISVGEIYIPKEYLYNSNFSKYFSAIKKLEEDNSNYKMNITTNYIQENSGIPIDENKYYYGKIYDVNKINIYKMQINDNRYIKIQLSTNRENVNYFISNEIVEEYIQLINYTLNNYTFIDYENKKKNGKKIIKFKISENINYLYIHFFNNKSENSEQEKYYTFKYNTYKERNNEDEYSIVDNNPKLNCTLRVKKKDKELVKSEIYYNKIKDQNNYIVVYSLKIVNKSDYINGEINDTIAITESIGTIIKFTKYKEDNNASSNNDTIDIPVNYFNKNFTSIELIAQIIDGENVEYISYEPITSMDNITIINIEEKSKTIFIISIVCSVLLIILIILLIFIFRWQKKKKDEFANILEQVEMCKPIEYEDVLLDNN